MKKIKEENKMLKNALKQAKRELAFFINVSKALTSTLEMDKIVNIIMTNVKKLVPSDISILFLINEERDDLYVANAMGKISQDMKGRRIAIGEGIAGLVALEGRPKIIKSTNRHRNIYDYMAKLDWNFMPKCILSVPIINKRKTMGVLELMNIHRGSTFTRKDMELLLKLVDQAAIAIERSNLYQKMANLAITDDLTKLFNLRYLYRALDQEVKRCRRYHSSFSIIFLDLDYFKLVNDRHGHLLGSKTLVEVASILVKNLRDVDIIARYGGDEFVIVLPHTPVHLARKIAERIQTDINNHLFLQEDGLNLKITASFGVAGYPEHAKDEIELLKLSDQAMYMAKSLGKNRVVMASEIHLYSHSR